MKVKELIEKLQKCDMNKDVEHQDFPYTIKDVREYENVVELT